jgi:hypothetical protein
MGFSHIVFGSIFCYNPLLERRVFMNILDADAERNRRTLEMNRECAINEIITDIMALVAFEAYGVTDDDDSGWQDMSEPARKMLGDIRERLNAEIPLP